MRLSLPPPASTFLNQLDPLSRVIPSRLTTVQRGLRMPVERAEWLKNVRSAELELLGSNPRPAKSRLTRVFCHLPFRASPTPLLFDERHRHRSRHLCASRKLLPEPPGGLHDGCRRVWRAERHRF